MRVVLTVSALAGTAGGAQKSVIELANELAERGHEPTLVGLEFPETPQEPPFYDVDPRVEVRTLTRVRMRPRHGRWALGDDRRRWRQAHRPMRRELRRILRDARADVAVGFLPSTFTHLALTARRARVPYVVANRNDPAVDYTAARYSPNPYDVALRGWAAAHAAANLVQIPEYVDDFPPEVRRRTRVIPNPVAAPQGNVSRRSKTIVSVGRLEPVKGHALVIEGFAAAGTGLADWQLDVYGEGAEHDALETLISRLGLAGRVELKGVHRDVADRVASASIYAAGSTFEGFSRALGEAMSVGTPAVVLDECRSNASLVRRSGGGMVVDASAGAMGEAFATLAGDPALRRTLGEHATTGAAAFAPKAVYDAWEDALQRAAARAPVHGGRPPQGDPQ